MILSIPRIVQQEMTDFENKYLNDDLTPEELRIFQEKVSSMDPSALEHHLRERWEADSFPKEDAVPAERIRDIKRRLDRKLRKRTFPGYVRRLLPYAAIIALVILGFLNYKLASDNKQLTSNEISIVTKMGEKVNVTLPDGTVVDLNEKSKITYRAGDFNKSSRQLRFRGEAYFVVAPNAACPFSIQTNCLDIKVLGTKFYLIDRLELEQSELILDEGSVQLSDINGRQTIILKSPQQAKWDFDRDHFVIKDSEIKGSVLRNSPRLSFIQTDFSDVIQALEQHYQIHITVEANPFQKYAFTGTLPSTNLPEALKIIERTYYLSANISNGDVHLYNQKRDERP